MIHSIVMKASEYRYEGMPLQMYFNDDDYFGLFAITAQEMFELEFDPTRCSRDILIREQWWSDTLDCNVGPLTVRQTLHKYSPVGVFKMFSRYKDDVRLFPVLPKYGDDEAGINNFLRMVSARSTAWALNYNKIVERTAKDTVFKLEPVKLTEDEILWHDVYKEMLHGKISQ